MSLESRLGVRDRLQGWIDWKKSIGEERYIRHLANVAMEAFAVEGIGDKRVFLHRHPIGVAMGLIVRKNKYPSAVIKRSPGEHACDVSESAMALLGQFYINGMDDLVTVPLSGIVTNENLFSEAVPDEEWRKTFQYLNGILPRRVTPFDVTLVLEYYEEAGKARFLNEGIQAARDYFLKRKKK